MSFSSFKKGLSHYLTADDIRLVENAYLFAKNAHKGQTRCSGKPYITHPLAVAEILLTLEQDAATLAAAFLHDTLEDCDVRAEDIANELGAEITQLVEGVTKLTSFTFASKFEEQAENFRKMLLAMTSDFRIMIIKLADRLHNMRTISYLNVEKQRRIARETLSIFAPLAHRLGMGSLKWELEDLSFQVLHHSAYTNLKKQVALKRKEREHYIDNVIQRVSTALENLSFHSHIYGRPKHLYSIYQKMQQQKLSFDELFDIYGLRIVTENKNQCYACLGILHALFKPIDGRFKDYIAVPKSNHYQSLHSTVIGPEGHPIEFQIRSKSMHEVAEMGVASHWRYKEGKSTEKIRHDFTWVKDLEQLQKESPSARDFLGALKDDLFPKEVFVFSPKGDVFSLKEGAVALDFAYRIHSDVGHRCKGVRINGQIKPLGTVLCHGDRLEVMTAKVAAPKKAWLSIVQTRHAMVKIQQWFKKQGREDLIVRGKELLEEWLSFYRLSLKTVLTSEKETAVLKEFSTPRLDQLYLLIAQGDIPKTRLLSLLLPDSLSSQPNLATPLLNTLPKKQSADLLVSGLSNILVYLARCCCPVPGDDLQGFITIGKGVSAHRSDCPHILARAKSQPERLVEVTWAQEDSCKPFSVRLLVIANDRLGLLQDILLKIRDMDINVLKVSASALKRGQETHISLVIDVTNRYELSGVIKCLTSLPDIYSVKRV
ncbi:MAG: bifunctional (p)ppGpp synthetase/guanosine-3',5'-bis(diphosphate) 3'-pyrophosphohydrolase [bacterium]